MGKNDKQLDGSRVEKINAVFNRLRARLYSLMETALSDENQANAAKKSVKDYTSQAWSDINKIVEDR